MSASIERFGTGPRLSQAVAYGDTVYLSGQVATASAGRSVTEQTWEVLKGIDHWLAQAGSDKTRILSAGVFITDIATFAEFNAVWEAWVPAGHTPARTTIETKLASPNYAIEVSVVAAR